MSARGLMTICRAVAEDLNARFDGQFTAVTASKPRFDAKTLNTLQVVTTPATLEAEIGAAATEWTYEVDVGFCKRPVNEAGWEALMTLVEDVADTILGTTLAPTEELTSQLICEKVGFSATQPYLSEEAMEDDLFVSILRLTYTYEA